MDSKLNVFENYGRENVKKYVRMVGNETCLFKCWIFKNDAFELGASYYIWYDGPIVGSPLQVICTASSPNEAWFATLNDHGLLVYVTPQEVCEQKVKIVKIEKEETMENMFVEVATKKAYTFKKEVCDPTRLYIIRIKGDVYFAKYRVPDHLDSENAVAQFYAKRTFKTGWMSRPCFTISAKDVYEGKVEIHNASDICDFSKLDSLSSAFDMKPNGDIICRCCGVVLERNERKEDI